MVFQNFVACMWHVETIRNLSFDLQHPWNGEDRYRRSLVISFLSFFLLDNLVIWQYYDGNGNSLETIAFDTWSHESQVIARNDQLSSQKFAFVYATKVR